MARKRHSSSQNTLDTTENLAECLTQAYRFWNAGLADKAEALCRKVLVAWPKQPDAMHLLGLVAYTHGNLELALDYVRQACRAPRAPGLFFRNLTEMCRQRGLLDEGERAGRQAVMLDGGNADGWNNLGIVLQESGKIEEALNCLRRALDLQPDDPKLLNNLGNCHRSAGDADEAERCYRRALELDPDRAQTYSNLSALVALRGEFDAAVQYARSALACEPQFADAYINLADIENTRYNRTEALHWLDALLTFAPNHVVALGDKARILVQIGRADEALDLARRATILAPDDGAALNRLGEVFQALGRDMDALEAYRKAAALPGRHVEDTLINMAILHRECGRIERGEAALARALSLYPKSVRALATRADGKKFRSGDPDIATLEELAADGGSFGMGQRANIHFALGKAYLDLDDGEHAFAHLDIGNRLKRSTFHYDADRTAAWLAAIAAAFPSAPAPAARAPASRRPVFVVGMPRSGTSLVEQILASHPEVAGAGELPILRLLVDRAGAFPREVPHWTDETYRRIGIDYLQATDGPAGGKPLLVDKMPSNFLYLGVIARSLPNARIIHCRRNPMDTCLSCYSRNFAGEQPFSYDQKELGLFYRAYLRLMAHWRTVLPAGKTIEVDYEAVVANPEEQIRRMLNFLGLTWDDACLRFYRTQRVVRTASACQVRQPIYRSAVGRWNAYAKFLSPLLAAIGTEK